MRVKKVKQTMNEQEWNEQIKQQNEKAITEAQRIHDLKQAAMQRVIEANRILVDAFRDEGIPLEMPENLSSIALRLSKIIRELDTKEQVELLGQGVDEFRVELPAWAQVK